MRERLSPTSLLREAAALFDAPETRLAESTRGVWRKGFVSGADWMRSALGLLRNEEPIKRNISFAALGCSKYSVAIMAALPAVALAIVTKQPWWLAAGMVSFYAVEAQMVFLFPLALDGRDFPFSESRRWTKHAGGTLRVMLKVMVIAATMIFGGFFGRGFARSWSLGCLAILIWYERLRQEEADGCEAARSVRRRLEIGASQPLLTRRVRLGFFDGTEPLRLLYASDLHCRELLSRATAQLIRAARELRPDVIVLGGDLVDSSNGLSRLTETIERLSACAPVWAIAGNHDHSAGVQEVRAAVERGGGNWLDGGSTQLAGRQGDPIFLDGGISGMMTTIDPNAIGRRILCAHDPKIFPEAAAIGYPLVLAGHLHGGQLVWAERRGRLFPGAWFYRWNGDRFDLGQSTLLVSRGVSGTLPLRWNCPREILLCELY